MRCRNCGHELTTGAKFCHECGQDQANLFAPTERIRTQDVPGVPPPPQGAQSGGAASTVMRGCLGLVVVLVLIVVVLALILPGDGGNETSENAGRTFTASNYAELATDPAAFEGASVDVVGELLANPEVRGEETGLQMYADPENLEWNTAVRTENAPDGLSNGDRVRVRGTVIGELVGENAFGAEVTAVEVEAESVEVIEAE